MLKPALTSHYEVFIQPPVPARNFIAPSTFPDNITELLTLSCSDASLPGSTLSTHELNNDFTGVTQRHAYRRLYDDRIDFSFYVNQEYDQIRYFEAWMRFVVGEEITGSENPYKSYRVKYPKYYKSPAIYITKFERDNRKKIFYSFFNAFPISVTSMPISYETSQLLKVTVSFSYDRYVASNVAIIPSTTQPTQSTANNVPNNPFELTPQRQAELNSAYYQNLNFGNFSFGTFTNTSFEGEELLNARTRRVEEGLPYVGRNTGPTSRWSGI